MHRACLESININTEFKKNEFLPNKHLTIDTINTSSDLTTLRRIVENEAADVAALVTELSSQNSDLAGKSFKMISIVASKIDSVNISHYFRSGRSYVEINHKKGIFGNLFFRAAFDNLFGTGKYHLIEQENRLCVICRA